MGNQIAVEQNPEDWLSSEAQNNVSSSYPRKHKQYLHIWRCVPEEQDLDIITTQPVSLLGGSFTAFKDNEVYIIIHVRYPVKVASSHSSMTEETSKEDQENLLNIIESTSVINPSTIRNPLVSKYDHKYSSVSSPYYEIYVWSGKNATVITQSVAIAKAHIFDQTLTAISAGSSLRTLTSSKFVPLASDICLSSLKKSMKDNTLFKAIFELCINTSKSKNNSTSANGKISFHLPIPDRRGSVPASEKKAAYSKFRKERNVGIKSMSALAIPTLEGLSSTTREPDEAALKVEKLNQFVHVCSRIEPALFLGGDQVANNKHTLQESEVTHIINCAGTICKNYFPSDFEYLTLQLYDSKNEDISCFFLLIVEYVDTVLSKHNGKVLFHCQQGVSRSSSLLIAYLMWKYNKTFDEIHKMVKEARGISNPNTGFIFQLLVWEKRLGLRAQQAQPWMMYVIPHSRADPVFVIRNVDPKYSSLDSRGIFLVQTSDYVYKWIGSKAHESLFAPADQYIVRLQKYLKAPSTCIEVREGEEPEDFCKLLGGGPTTAPLEKPVYNPHFALLMDDVSVDSEETSSSSSV